MAGLIAAHGRATGIAPDAKVLPVRFQALSGIPTTQVGRSIEWAVDHGATVLCLAFVGQEDLAVHESIDRAIAKNVVVVAGLGNTSSHADVFPGAYPGVVAVAGTDKDGGHATVSLTGSQAVLAAPAVRILSTYPRTISADGYATADGTSNSTAIVAGVAALIRAKYPNLSASEVIHRMTATADDKGPPGRDAEYGYGIVNPVRALTADIPPLTTSPSPNANPEPPSTGGPRPWWWLVIPVAAVALAAGFIARARRR
jgi:subtilisin family serine protease